MRTSAKSQRLLISTLERWEVSGTVEPGTSRAAKAALRQVKRARTDAQRDKALNKFLRSFLRDA